MTQNRDNVSLYFGHGPLAFRVSIDPSCVASLGSEGELEDLVNTRIGLELLLIHNDRNLASSSSCGIETWSIGIVFCHRRVGIHTRISSTPINVAIGLNRVIEVGVGEDGTVQRVPGTAKRALASEYER